MIDIVKGDILEAHKLYGVEALVCPVNCYGAMGAGLALAFKKRFDCSRYFELCDARKLLPGNVYVIPSEQMPVVVLAATKNNWRNPSRIEWIRQIMADLPNELFGHGLSSVAIPALGCGLGGLFFEEVRPIIENAFARYPHTFERVVIYEP